jgi:hypothetical protein
MSALLALVLTVTGLHGVVLRGPTTPVCRVGVPCTEPARGAVLAFTHDGRVVQRVHVGVRGRYAVRLAPGVYTVSVTPRPRVGSGIRPLRVWARRGRDSRVDFTIDTGIR